MDVGRGWKFAIDGRPIRPSPSGLKKDGAIPSSLRTDGIPPSRPVLSNVGRTGRLTTLSRFWITGGFHCQAVYVLTRTHCDDSDK
jgi:hypothetical protein